MTTPETDDTGVSRRELPGSTAAASAAGVAEFGLWVADAAATDCDLAVPDDYSTVRRRSTPRPGAIDRA